jgi:hypothetical protein
MVGSDLSQVNRVAGDFAPAGRMTNINRVLQVKLLDEIREIIGVKCPGHCAAKR